MTSPNAQSDCCPPLLDRAIAADEAQQLAKLFRVLGEPARLRLLSAISTHPNREACVCDLIEPLGLSQPTVSHHLKTLYGAGLVDRERRGTWIYYRLVPQRLAELQQVLRLPAR